MKYDNSQKEKLFNIDEKTKPEFLKHAELAIFYMLLDSEKYNDEPLRPLDKPIFDTAQPIARTDVKESLILDLLYSDELCRA